MQAADPAVANAALVLYLDCCRRLLTWHNGYECQHTEGDLMLAFANTNDAVLWSLLVSRKAILPLTGQRRLASTATVHHHLEC